MWLPLDATWGIFSGKLPVCHIFRRYFKRSSDYSSFDKIKFGESKIKVNFLE